MSGRFTPWSAQARGRGDCRLRFSLVVAVLFVLSFVTPPHAQSQVVKVVAAPANGNSGGTVLERGFGVVFDDRLADSLTRFEEQVQARAWEKAFRIIADIPDEKWDSMLPDRNGFIRPASHRLRNVLLELPADGREAYRIFFDAKARILFDTARHAQKEEDLAVARAIYDRYFITSVGDEAADRLADDSYERGQFVEATRYWKSIFDFHPDTKLSEARLHVKWAMALFRAGLAEDFQNAVAAIERDYPAVRVVLGGREVNAADFLKSLSADKESPQSTIAGAISESPAFEGLAPAENAQPAWRFRFLQESDWDAVQASARNFWGGAAITAVVPAVATDGQRVFCNWIGYCFAIDAASGKTVWTNPPNSDAKSLLNRMKGTNNIGFVFYATNMSQFAIAAGKGVVLTVSVPLDHFGQDVQWGNTTATQFNLVAYEAATGKELWDSKRVSGLAKLSFIGTPLIDGASLLAVTNQPGATNELVLRRLDLRTGNELWSLRLGTPQLVGDPDFGQQFLPIPYLALSAGKLYVLTDDGALLAIDVSRHQLEWAFKYDPPTTAGARQRFVRNAGNGRHSTSTGPIAVRDGVIYFKESNNPTLYALEEAGPRLKWKWQDAEFANFVGVDDQNVYLFSDELSAVPRAKPETRWSNRLSVEMQGLGAHVGRQAVLVFTPRGLFELSKDTGDVRRIFRAQFSAAGGIVMPVGNRLICVSNMAVTAYAEPPAR